MSKTRKIVLTGPESVGKSTLTQQLAEYYKMPYVSEIARSFIESLSHHYTIDDVIKIAKLQVEAEKEALSNNPKIVFFDTDLVITKVWLQHVYGNCPDWINDELKQNPADLHLLCYYDLPWESDSVRENPDIRPFLFNKYESEIKNYGVEYKIVKGFGDLRFKNAVSFIEMFLKFNSK